jgi:hypothetical protein
MSKQHPEIGTGERWNLERSSTAAKILDPVGIGSVPEVPGFIDCEELARRLCLPVSWVRDQVRARAEDPIPHARIGKYVRFKWGSPELEAWISRRMIGSNNSKVGRDRRKETIQ